MPKPKVCVIGSSNLDMNCYVERFPQPGETLHGTRFTTGYGGKGANQAVMAARLGAEVALIARVGNDLFGRDMTENLRHEGIDTRFVKTTEGIASGVAVITVDAAGRNQIVVIPGANGSLTPDDVEDARSAIETAAVLVCQMEVPLEANLAAMWIANKGGVRVIFNPAPAPATLPDEVFQLSTIFCPNEHEAAILTGVADAETAARRFLMRGAKEIAITLGERGCLLVNAERVRAIPAPKVQAVDTTGAGDAFLGSLAFYLAQGDELAEAAGRACRIAARSVQRQGTQSSFPRKEELFDGD